MTKRAIRHRFITEGEIQEKMDERKAQSMFSHGPSVVEQRFIKRTALWALKEVSIYNRYPWLKEETQCMS